jgi:hypothetical protein
MGNMLTAAATIALSWDLTPADVNCNLMPSFMWEVLSAVFFSVDVRRLRHLLSSFDPSIFWALLEEGFFVVLCRPDDAPAHYPNGNRSTTMFFADPRRADSSQFAHDCQRAAGGPCHLWPCNCSKILSCQCSAIVRNDRVHADQPPPATYNLESLVLRVSLSDPRLHSQHFHSQVVATWREGPICVRGEPCFADTVRLLMILRVGDIFEGWLVQHW